MALPTSRSATWITTAYPICFGVQGRPPLAQITFMSPILPERTILNGKTSIWKGHSWDQQLATSTGMGSLSWLSVLRTPMQRTVVGAFWYLILLPWHCGQYQTRLWTT